MLWLQYPDQFYGASMTGVVVDNYIYASVIFILSVAVFVDVVRHRIPNFLVIIGFIFSLAILLYFQGLNGFGVWIAGMALGGGIFLPLYFLGGMAAGDVKLMAVVGAHIGFSVLWAAAFTMISGLVLGLLFLAYRKGLAGFLKRYWLMAGMRRYLPADETAVEKERFPYAVAIFFGTGAAIFLNSISEG